MSARGAIRDWHLRLLSSGWERLEDRLCLSGPSLAMEASGAFVGSPGPAEADTGQSALVCTPRSLETPLAARGEAEAEADFSRAVASINRFASDLYQHFQEQAGNLFLSPLSIATALAMTYAGARGATASQMADVLHLGVEPGVHEAFRALFESLDRGADSPPFELSMANALWPQQGFPLRGEFLERIDTDYGGGSQSLDYRSAAEQARLTINNWVEQQTHGKIRDLIPPGALSEATRLVLTNAVYFKGRWATQFDPQDTSERPFYRESGQAVNVPMMYLQAKFRYLEQAGFQVLEMPYDGEDLSMVILLPLAGAGTSDLTSDVLAGIDDSLASVSGQRDVIVRLPKFETTVSSSLADVLAGMGMPLAFDRTAADFSAMADLAPDERLFIDAVLHKAFVEVNEEGTEAAAATAVSVAVTSCYGCGTPVLEFNADHPFHFYIRDNATRAMLFLGRLTDPLQLDNVVLPQVSAAPGEPSESSLVQPSWTNLRDRFDVTGRDGVTPLDALLIINHIRVHGAAALPAPPPSSGPYYDVNGDGLCTASDALQVIDRINGTSAAVGEGEADLLDSLDIPLTPLEEDGL